jgi:ABC-type multidrug transport system fused ATPase/permease subunit
MLRKSANLKLKDFENDLTYDIITRAQNQKAINIILLSDNIISLVRKLITIISLILILSQFEIWLMLIVIIVPMFKSIYSIKIAKEQYKINVNRTDKERKAWYIDYLLSKGYAYKEINIFGITKKLINSYLSIKNALIKQDIKIAKKNFVLELISVIIDAFIITSIMSYIIVKGFMKKILIGDAIVYIETIQSLSNNIESMFGLGSSLVNDLFYTELLFQFLDYEVSNRLQDDTNSIILNEIESIELKNIYYKYNNNSYYTLKNINLKLERGKTIAILGKNGSGKTSLTKIILGFYDDYEGDILINGINLKNINKKWYKNQMSCLFQDYIKYEATIGENIAIGKGFSIGENYKVDKIVEEKILELLKKTNIKEEIYKEKGIDTILGNWFGKKQLSIGEWQRIAICRTMIKEAQMYILDEPDSSLDLEASKQLILLYKKIFKDKIGIFITHDISLAKLITDKIIVLENGEIKECGNHENLMKKKGAYYDLFTVFN